MSMNDDQNLKKLTERLVAMSPEPPPFPEEVTMSTPSPARSPFQPLAVFAAALVVVLLGFGIPFVLMNGNGGGVADDTTTTSTTLADTTTTTEAQSTTTVTSIVDNVEYVRTVFVLTESDNSFLGNPALVPLETTVHGSENVDDLLLAVQLLATVSQSDANLPEGYFSAIPADVVVNSIDYGPDFVATVDMNAAFLDGGGGLLADFTMLNQLIYTFTADPDVSSIVFTVNGDPVEAFGSEGLDLSSAVDRETFQEHLALIYLTSPILANQDGNIVVTGISNTFEASLSLRVLDGEGNIVHEEFTTATCGSGCWGEYIFVLDPDLFDTDYTVQLLEYSAEDGDPANVISVPWNGGEPWDLLP